MLSEGAIAGSHPGIADINNISGIISGRNENESFINYKFIGIRTIYIG